MLVIFDWDGTLSDSIPKIVRSVNTAAQQTGLPERSYAEVQNIVGLGLYEAISALYPSIEESQVEALRSCYAEIYVELDRNEPSPFFPGALELIDLLHERGHQVAVATGKSRRGLERVLEQHQVRSLFHASRCADESGSKPNPAMLNEILSELDVPAEQALMVGDTEFDLEMAHAIDMPRIGVTYGAHDVRRLRRWSPLACIDSIQDLIDVVEL